MKYLYLCILLLAASFGHAQSYSYDSNSGAVTIDGKPAFFVLKTGGTLGYTVRNSTGGDLIRVSNGEMNKEGRGDMAGYKFTFVASGSNCSFMPAGFGANAARQIIHTILRQKLIVSDTVNAESEARFVLANRGRYFGPGVPQVATAAVSGVPVQAPQPPPIDAPATPGKTGVRLQGDKIYSGNRLIGSFRSATDGAAETATTSVLVYDSKDIQVAQVMRRANSTSDWTITLSADNKMLKLRYYPDRSLERVFELLQEQGYLR